VIDFGLSRKDSEVRDQWSIRIKGATGLPKLVSGRHSEGPPFHRLGLVVLGLVLGLGLVATFGMAAFQNGGPEPQNLHGKLPLK